MNSVTKDVYNTIKRSISATTNGLVNNFGNGNSNITRLSNTSNGTGRKHWIHPPEDLMNGRVDYVARLWGKVEVPEAKGSLVVQDAIHVIRFQHQINKGIAGHSGSKLPKVIIQISAERIAIVDQKTNKNLHAYSLNRISFCADDKQDARVFALIVKTEEGKHLCFAFMSEKMAGKITTTIGQAFDLSYEKYCRSKSTNSRKELENQKKVLLLQKRIAQLENEKAILKAENEALKLGANGSMKPIVPDTPIPPIPNPQTAVNPVAIAPPPQHSSRRGQQIVPTQGSNTPVSDMLFSLNDVFNREKQEPDVGTRLQNLQIDRMEDLFDDEFDPRAGEKKKEDPKFDTYMRKLSSESLESSNTPLEPKTNGTEAKNGTGTAAPPPETSTNTVEDFEALLKQIDERLAFIHEGFDSECLERGDTGDTGRDMASEYSTLNHQRNGSPAGTISTSQNPESEIADKMP